MPAALNAPLRLLLLLVCCWLAAAPHRAAAQDEVIAERLANLRYQTGTVLLPRAHARIDVPAGWHFVTAEDLGSLFDLDRGSLREMDTLGWLLPGTVRIEDENAWAIDLEISDSGYVVEDSENLDPYRLVWRMRDVYRWAQMRNTEFKDSSYELINFARAPVFDRAQHIVTWTERLRYPDDGGKELIDVYGFAFSRRGALCMQATDMPPEWQDEIEAGVETLIRSVRFDVGERYEDFSSADEVAEYELSHVITAEWWVGPQTWGAWLSQPVNLKLPFNVGGKPYRFKAKIPNWAFWGAVSLVGLLLVARWIRGGGRKHKVPVRGRPATRGGRR